MSPLEPQRQICTPEQIQTFMYNYILTKLKSEKHVMQVNSIYQ